MKAEWKLMKRIMKANESRIEANESRWKQNESKWKQNQSKRKQDQSKWNDLQKLPLLRFPNKTVIQKENGEVDPPFIIMNLTLRQKSCKVSCVWKTFPICPDKFMKVKVGMSAPAWEVGSPAANTTKHLLETFAASLHPKRIKWSEQQVNSQDPC